MSHRSLADFPYVLVRIGCLQCPRQGRYRLARLAERYGAAITLLELLERLSENCPIRATHGAPGIARCGALFPDLSGGGPADEPAAVREKLRVVR